MKAAAPSRQAHSHTLSNKMTLSYEQLALYADVLESYLLPLIQLKKQELQATTVANKFTLPICEWTHVGFNEPPGSLDAYMAKMNDKERQQFLQRKAYRDGYLFQQGWVNSQVSAKGLSPQSIDLVFRTTDLPWRLATALGPRFVPKIVGSNITPLRAPRDPLDYVVSRYSLVLAFCPDGLDGPQTEKMNNALARHEQRKADNKIHDGAESMVSHLRYPSATA